MNRGLVNLKELRKNILQADFEGTTAYCFVNGNKIIKVYAKPNERGRDYKFISFIDSSKVCDFSKFSADTILFPTEYIYENGQIAGEISKYIKDKSIDKSFNDLARINSIISGYESVISDMQVYDNIYMADLCFVNILFSNKNGFHIIDTTEWIFKENSFRENMRKFNMSLLDVIIDRAEMPITYSKYYNKVNDNFIDNIEKYGNAGNDLKDSVYEIMSNKYNFLKFMFAYMNTYRIHYGEDPKTLKDINEFTKVLKKG